MQLTECNVSSFSCHMSSVMFSDVIVRKETLLNPPSYEEPVFDRHEPSYSGCSEHFCIGDRSFSRQYAHIYATRLMQMRQILADRATQKWGQWMKGCPCVLLTILNIICMTSSDMCCRFCRASEEAVWSADGWTLYNSGYFIQTHGAVALHPKGDQWRGIWLVSTWLDVTTSML